MTTELARSIVGENGWWTVAAPAGESHRPDLAKVFGAATGAVPDGETPRWGKMVAPGMYGPNHQHFVNFRMDMSVDAGRLGGRRRAALDLPPSPPKACHAK